MAARNSGIPEEGVYLVKPASSEPIAAGLDVLGRVEVGLTSAEADDILTFGFHGLGLAVDR